MNKKKTILKTIEMFFKNHTEDKPKDPTINKATKKSILKVIDKDENIADRTTDTTFPAPAEPVISESSNFKVKQDDYEITDLTKKEPINNDEVQPPREEEININTILNTLDKRLEENEYHHTLNILTTRSSKDVMKESALVEYTLFDKSYVMSIIVEQVEDKYKFSLKSSYGKEIYTKITDLNGLNEAVYYPFSAIALRDKFSPVLNECVNKETISNAVTNYILDNKESSNLVESALAFLTNEYHITISDEVKEIVESVCKKLNETVDSDRLGEIMVDVEEYVNSIINPGTEPEGRVEYDYEETPGSYAGEVVFKTGSKANMEMVRDYIENKYPELEMKDRSAEGTYSFSIK